MLFNSYEFIFVFFPVVLGVFFVIGRRWPELAISWLVLSSLFFYGWWQPVYLILILFSMVFNFGVGKRISTARKSGAPAASRAWTFFGVTVNLCLLGYFKYAGFLVTNINFLAGTSIDIGDIFLPLAISFFTFQQIAYLIDTCKGLTEEYQFSHYSLFVTFFPQLIAGPIVHHGEMLPQFARPETFSPRLGNLTIGGSIFAIGLFKKTVLADGVAAYATPIFDAAADGQVMTLFQAWGGVLAYTMQLYFDFSGYSDMAIGGARLFGIRLPLNFHSPYKAANITEFWRRWHMTLSRFLRDYVYIPLGGNRAGRLRRYQNLLATMLIGGLWHGAGWNFVIWGGLHGLYLVVHQGWQRIRADFLPGGLLPARLGKFLAWLITFTAVVVGWVFFRATDLDSAIALLRGMAGLNGVSLPNGIAVRLGPVWDLLASLGFRTYLTGGADFIFTWLWIGCLLPIALIWPNTQQIMRNFEPALNEHVCTGQDEVRLAGKRMDSIQWRPALSWGILTGVIAGLGVLALTRISEFLYFQF